MISTANIPEWAKRLAPICMLAIGCSHPIEATYKVTAIQVPEVEVRIAYVSRFADQLLTNEVAIWERIGYTCEVKYVWDDREQVQDNVWLVVQREIHACWKVTLTTIQQPSGVT